jgi:hypothetical protein
MEPVTPGKYRPAICREPVTPGKFLPASCVKPVTPGKFLPAICREPVTPGKSLPASCVEERHEANLPRRNVFRSVFVRSEIMVCIVFGNMLMFFFAANVKSFFSSAMHKCKKILSLQQF